MLGARGRGGEEWGGGQKADQQGFREQRPVGWDGGPKRETRGAIGDPGILPDRGLQKPGNARTGGWEGGTLGTAPSVGLPLLCPHPSGFQFFPAPSLLERH